MGQRINLTGQRFGRLVVESTAESSGPRARWLCFCDCGRHSIVLAGQLRSGRTSSCGCLQAEWRKAPKNRSDSNYGLHLREYNSWRAARRRCVDPKDPKYAIYGARGISMCDEWSADFKTFLRDMGPRPQRHTLERKDTNGHYEPGNCRWATPREQANNMRSNVFVIFNGERLTVAEVARRTNVGYRKLLWNVRRGHDVHHVVNRLVLSGPKEKRLPITEECTSITE